MVVVYGTVCRDRLHCVQHLPPPGGYVEITEDLDMIGGEAVNTALALSRWGVDNTLTGNSPGTPELTQMLVQASLNVDHLPDAAHPEAVCDIYVTPDGQRTMFGRGFTTLGEWADLDRIPMSAGSWLTIDANHGAKGIEAAVRAKCSGMLVYVEDCVEDAGPECEFWQSSTDWVGARGDSLANQAWLQERLSCLGGFGILSDGANGFVAGGRDANGEHWPVRHYPAFACPHVVDSTGAGDVFRAGMLYGLENGLSIPDGLRTASMAGCLCCRTLGASAPDMSEIQAEIQRQNEVSRLYD